MTTSVLLPIAHKELGDVFSQFTVGFSQYDAECFGNALLDLYSDPIVLRLTRDRSELSWQIGASGGPYELHCICYLRDLLLGRKSTDPSFESDSQFIRTHISELKDLFSAGTVSKTSSRLKELAESWWREEFPELQT